MRSAPIFTSILTAGLLSVQVACSAAPSEPEPALSQEESASILNLPSLAEVLAAGYLCSGLALSTVLDTTRNAEGYLEAIGELVSTFFQSAEARADFFSCMRSSSSNTVAVDAAHWLTEVGIEKAQLAARALMLQYAVDAFAERALAQIECAEDDSCDGTTVVAIIAEGEGLSAELEALFGDTADSGLNQEELWQLYEGLALYEPAPVGAQVTMQQHHPIGELFDTDIPQYLRELVQRLRELYEAIEDQLDQ